MTQASTIDSNLVGIQAIEADICAGKFAEAAAAINAMIVASPSDPRIYLSAAMLARAARNPKQEIISLQYAVAAAPQWPPAHGELAKALSREGHHGNAVALANRAVELAPQEMATIEVAVAVANAAGDFATAQRHLQSALALRPSDSSIRKALGICLERQGRFGEAEPHWRAMLEQNPDDASALGWLGLCLIGLDRKSEACVVLQRAVTLWPEHPSLPFHLAVARGETPSTQPREMIQQLFDGYAGRFDQHLVQQLKYDVPKRVAKIIRERHPGLDVSVLDLGCGTGLLGANLGRIGRAFVGVDVSPRMIEHAARHNVYTELRETDLLDELRRTTADSFDCVTANDVFIYVGDLSEVIPSAFKVLRSGGALIFSCETADESEGALVLRPSKRYAHSRSSVEALCQRAGFGNCDIAPIELRFDLGNVPIVGFMVVAQKR
ncbi:MAG: methyltransferase domain-containing protein [Rudaea sp.]|nr:methyltransferase domain-containing protein [Rudaea sp.]